MLSVSVWCGRLDGRVHVAQDEAVPHYAASTMKLPLVVAAYRLAERGVLDLARSVPVHNALSSAHDGRAFSLDPAEDQDDLTWSRLGGSLSLGQLARQAVVESGNLATNLLLEQVGTPAVSDVLRDAGCSPATTVLRGIEDVAAREAGIDNLVTAEDLGRVMVGIGAGTLAGGETCRTVEALLADQRHRDKIPAGLPPLHLRREQDRMGGRRGARRRAGPPGRRSGVRACGVHDDGARRRGGLAADRPGQRDDVGGAEPMGRIERVTCHRVTVPLHTPFVTALRRTTTVESLLVEVTDSDGVSGWGEAPQVWQVTGESALGAEACVSGPLAAVVTRADPSDLAELTRRVSGAVARNFGAKAAVDVALHDLLARRRGVSLPELLGTTTHEVTTDVTLSAGADDLADTAARRVKDGFRTLKLKVGTDAADDVARVLEARAAVGPAVALRLDANQGWSPREAVRVISALEEAGASVELVEQPVAAEDLDGLAWVTGRVGTPVMADEAVYGLRDLVEVIRRRAADMVNVKLAKCGGLGPGRALLDLARAHGMGTIVGSMMETQVGVGAAASLAVACGTTAVADLDAAWWASSSPVRGGLRYDGDTVVLPRSPGLGVDGLA